MEINSDQRLVTSAKSRTESSQVPKGCLMFDQKAYAREYYRNRRRSGKEYALKKLGEKCVQCGSTERLEFDHVDLSTKSYNISHLYEKSKELLDAELLKCQLLCSKCHKAKTGRDYTYLDHGKGMSGKKGCMCTLCKEARAAYDKERNKK